MPEGDTIFKTAVSLRRWLEGRSVTSARSTVLGPAIEPVVGTTVERIEPRAKHLLIRFSSGLVLHTHMRMTGSWHVYPTGERWRRPAWQARVELTCGERMAVCFNAPVIELLHQRDERTHPSLAGLGPDVLSAEFDLDEVIRRAALRPRQLTLGELLLDQQVVSGIGNIYRCESLFLAGHHPWTTQSGLEADQLSRLVLVAARLMRANVAAGSSVDRRFGGAAGHPWVYRRNGRPCRRCGTPIAAGRLGIQARAVYWCPSCQSPAA
jgi:endonuclease-8